MPADKPSSDRFFRLLRLLITVIFTLTVFNRWVVYNTPLEGVDGSWAIALHLVREAGLTYGTEFIFTYGPLGWYVTRLPIAVAVWEIVLLDLVYLLHMGGIIWLSLGRRFSWLRYGLIAGLVALHTLTAGIETPFVFYFFVLAYLGYYQRKGQVWALAGASVLAVLTFYMKANVGLVSIISVVGYLLWRGLFRQMPLRHLGIGLASLALLLTLSLRVLPVQLVPYLRAQWHLIDSYNDVMYLQPGVPIRRAFQVSLVILLVATGAFGWPLYALYKTRRLRTFLVEEGALFGLAALQLFILFKESFVRADAGHIGFFYKYGLMPFAIPALFSAHAAVRKWAVLPMVLLVGLAPRLVPFNWNRDILYRWLTDTAHYCQDALNPVRPALASPANPIPEAWLRLVGNKRVDVMPSDISLVYQYGLRYAPRPTMQTYQVTDRYLDSLNAAYYTSPRAADFVFVTWDAIDDRDPFSDEILTKLALRDRYRVVDQHGKWLLLGRKAQPSLRSTVARETRPATVNQPIPVDTTGGSWQFWEIDARYKPMASVQRLLFQPPAIHLEMTYATGERDTFRTAIPLLKAGLLTAPHPRDLNGLTDFLRGHDQRLPRPASVRILADTTLIDSALRQRVSFLSTPQH